MAKKLKPCLRCDKLITYNPYKRLCDACKCFIVSGNVADMNKAPPITLELPLEPSEADDATS